MMDVFYYYIFLFYAKVLPDDYPHSNTVWALGAISAFIVNGLIDIPLAYFFNCYLYTIQKVIITIILLLFFFTLSITKVVRENELLKKRNLSFLVVKQLP